MKVISRRILALVYLGAVVIAFLILIKPGASIFFIKKNIDSQAVIQDAGYAFRYKLAIDPRIIRTQGIMLFEDGQPLTLAPSDVVASSGNRAYAISTTSEGQVYLYFSASDNSNPQTNGRTYRLYLPLRFISRPWGLLFLIILLPLVARFLLFALGQAEHRRAIFHSLANVLHVLDLFFDQLGQSIKADIQELWTDRKTGAAFWKRLFTGTILAAYLYVFMEWVFFVTMPSFMSLMSFFEKVKIFLLSGLGFSILCMVVLAAFILVDILALIAGGYKITRHGVLIVPTIILACLILLLVDNFSYTIFKFGISTSTGIARAVYGALFVLLSGYIYWHVLKLSRTSALASTNNQSTNRWFLVSVAVLVVSAGLALANMNIRNLTTANPTAEAAEASSHPNILLLGSDGLSADHLSVYGYERDTTPRLSVLVQGSLVADNAFPNAATTAGSIVAMMTSKLPTETRVLYPPNILTGVDSFEHLPGILKNEGYETIEFGAPYFIDAYNFNFQNAYDMVNNRTQGENRLTRLGQRLGYETSVYFINKLTERISDRLQHIFFIREMQNPFQIVTQPVESISDEQKINQTLDLLDQANQPMFIHVHLVGTHGPKYEPPVQVFSKGETQDQGWMVDFYDDTLLAFDKYVGQVIDHLKASGQYEHTILIIYSDHNFRYHLSERIPLIFHFPSDQFAGRITSNVQNLDVAPTILDYLGVTVPEWMEGESLLKGNLDPHRLIFGVSVSEEMINENNRTLLDPNLLKPPFYQFGVIDVIDCQKWHVMNLTTFNWVSGDIPAYIAPCSQSSLLSMDEIKQATENQLAKDGFDISSIP